MIPKERVISVLEGEKPDKVPISIFTPPHPIACLNMIDEMEELKPLRWLPQYLILRGKFSDRKLPDKLENLLLFSVQGVFSDISHELGCDMVGILPPFGELDAKTNIDGEVIYHGTNYQIKDGIFWRVESGDFPVKTVEDKNKIKPMPAPTESDYTRRSLRSLNERYEDKFLVSMIEGPLWALGTFMGMENLLMSLVERPEDMKELLAYTTKIQIKIAKPVINEIDAVIIADDYGTQESLQISKEMWDEFIKPNLKEMVSELKKDGYVFMHTDGYIEPLIPDFLDMGLDAINPIQEGANDLDKILEKYDDLVLLGGIDVQKTLPRKSPQEIRERITSIMKAAYPNLILADTNPITNETPVSNVRAVFEACEEFNESLS